MRSLWGSCALALALIVGPSIQAHAESYDPTFIGLVLGKSSPDSPLIVQKVLAGSPAEAAGLLADDQILAIDGADTEALSLGAAIAKMRGPIGTWITLAMLSGENRFDLSLQRTPAS